MFTAHKHNFLQISQQLCVIVHLKSPSWVKPKLQKLWFSELRDLKR